MTLRVDVVVVGCGVRVKTAAKIRARAKRSTRAQPRRTTPTWRAPTIPWYALPSPRILAFVPVSLRLPSASRVAFAACRPDRRFPNPNDRAPPPPGSQQVHGTALETRGEITATAYDTSGTRMVTTTADGAIHVWDRADGPDGAPGRWRQSAAWSAPRSPCARRRAFAPAEHGRCIASSDIDGVVRIWREPPRAPTPAAAAAALAAAEAGAAVGNRRRALGAVRRRSPPRLRPARTQPAARHRRGRRRRSFLFPDGSPRARRVGTVQRTEALAPLAACTAVCWRRARPLDES